MSWSAKLGIASHGVTDGRKTVVRPAVLIVRERD